MCLRYHTSDVITLFQWEAQMNTNQRIIEEYFDTVWNTGDMQAQQRVIAPDYTGYWLIKGMPVREGPNSHQAWVENVRSGLPDARYSLNDIIADGDRVVARVTLSGTHLGPIAGRAPTGKSTVVDQIFVFHLANGQICTEWVSFDRESFMKQLEP